MRERLSGSGTPVATRDSMPIASPFSGPGNLQRIVVDDVFGTDVPVNTRAAAMRLGPIARGRNLIVSLISACPLVQLGPGESVPGRPIADPGDYSPEAIAARDAYAAAMRDFYLRQPTWLYRTDTGTTPQHRLAWTVDDLIFYGASLWWRTRRADRFPLAGDRVNRSSWSINADNQIEIDGIVQRDEDVILIPGLHEGILSYGVDAIRDAKTLNRIVRDRMRNPVPQIDLHQTGGPDLTPDEIKQMVGAWAGARQGEDGGVSYTNKWIEAKPVGGGEDASLMIEGRNAAALELARVIGVSANRLDATSAKASLNYETTTGRNQELVDFDLALYMSPIIWRLSLDDCCPSGQRVVFDLTDLLAKAPSASGPNNQD